jgi:RNA polymerase sigma-70 factor (ECF subfamily)
LKDIRLINDILNGDQDKYAVIMEKYHNELFKYIYNLTGNVNDTEDLLQEVFIKIYQNLVRYDASRSSFRTWMYRITTNHCYNHFKSAQYRHKQKTSVYDDDINQASDDVEKNTVVNKQIEEILAVMQRVLKTKHYQIMMLHYFSQMSVKEISETMAVPEKTIYKAIKSSIEKIKKEVNVSDEI